MYTWPSFSARRLALLVFIALLFAAAVYADNTPDNLQSATPLAASSSPAPVQGHQVWNYTTGNWIASSPAVENGMVYIGSEDGHVYAITANTGTVAWNDQIGNYVSSSPGISGNIVYIGSGDGNLYALDAGTGAVVWKYQAGASISSSPAITDGTVYAGSEDGTLSALDAASGSERWHYTTGSYLHSSPAVAGGIVYFGSYDHNVYALNATTGSLAWNYTTGDTVLSSPAVANGIVYIGSYDHNVYALNAGSGAVVWKYATGGTIRSSPAVSEGVVYIGSGDGNIYALDANSGAARWTYKTGGEVDSTPRVDNGTVYAGNSDGNLYALNAANGQPLWYYPTGNSGDSSPAIAGRIVYIGSYNHNLYALSNQPPVADFSADVTSGDTPVIVHFTDTSTGSPTSWLWDFGDGETSTLENPAHTYVASGTFTVNLTAANGGGSDSMVRQNYITTITILPPPPVANFTIGVTGALTPVTVRFTDISTGSPTSWLWDFGDGNTSTAENPTYTYVQPGQFVVTLTAKNRGGSSTVSLPTPITVQPRVIKPGPAFTANVTSGTPPLAVQFTDASTGPGITAWAWDFVGNGTIDSTAQNPICVYQQPGNYTVNLTVTNSFGTRSIVKTDFITVASLAPTVSFTANSTAGTPPLAVQFSDTSVGQNITGWAWDFNNDGIIDSTEQDPVCVYKLPGNYTVNLTVTNAYGSGTLARTDFITVGSPAPVAAFNATPVVGAAPLNVQFTDTSVGQNITGWAWDFNNDGIIDSTVQNPTMVYTKPGNYTADLTVTDADGSNTTTKAGFILVTNGVIPNFTADTTTGLAPLTVHFHDTSVGQDITGWAWDFNNDGIIDSTDQDPVCVYNQPGNYTVNLTVTNALGTNAIIKKGFITVTSLAPIAGFTANTTYGVAPVAVQFTDTSVGQDIAGWAWDFNGDGIIDSTLQNPTMIYTKPGNYTVNLTVTNSYGTNTTSEQGYVLVSNGVPVARFAVNKTSGPAPLVVQFRDISRGPTITSWSWDFNDDGIVDSTDQNPVMVYNLPGNYTINYTVSNAYGTSTILRKDFITVTN